MKYALSAGRNPVAGNHAYARLAKVVFRNALGGVRLEERQPLQSSLAQIIWNLFAHGNGRPLLLSADTR